MSDLVTPSIKTLNPLPRSGQPPLANLKLAESKDFATVVVFGKGGQGKTYVGISKTPTPVEWIDVDHRSDTQFKRFKDRIAHLYTPNTREEIENSVAWALYYLREHYEKTGVKGTIVLDSYTKSKQIVKEDMLISLGKPTNSKTTIEEKSQIKATMARIIDNIKHSQMNVVVTAEEGVEIIGEEKENGKQKIIGVVPGVCKNTDDLEYFCDYIVHLYSAQVKQANTSQFVERHLWKFRKSSTSRIVENADLAPQEDCDWDKIMNEIKLLNQIELKK
ncbi:MAG: AAA family ATPase [Pedobacter sp.]|uniref:AAA family ATPase n=1 Tax=Pedobacter sp. TaxID=1411316 RepID=UPI00356798DD